MQLASIADILVGVGSAEERTEQIAQKHQGQLIHKSVQQKGIGHDNKIKRSNRKFFSPGL